MGGLTVLSELKKYLPHENFIYVGDTARVPYGSRSEKTVQRYSLEIAEYLKNFNIKMLIIACNTATAHAEILLKEKLEIPVIGVVEPGVNALITHTINSRVGVIGTRATVKSSVYQKLIDMKKPGTVVFAKATPLLVPIVEEGFINHESTGLIIKEYLKELVDQKIDTLVLGCTHYPILKPAIQKEYPGLDLIDSSIETARAAAGLLEEKSIKNESDLAGYLRIFVTDKTEQILGLEKLFLGFGGIQLEEVKIPEE